MARTKPNRPRRTRVEGGFKPDYSGMFAYPEIREITASHPETGVEESVKVTVHVRLNRASKRANGAHGEQLQGIATLAAGFPQKRAMKRVSGGRLTGAL